jgi:hypothetical protein
MKVTSTSTKVGVIHWLKSLWDFKSEIGSLHFTNFILIKVISWVKAHYHDPIWGCHNVLLSKNVHV